ncbi:glycerol-3-phosphate acyltransferase [Alienimonas chondri]|uniref:Glycerol-3-phosphate acyltransferase n=1 Tax=Alienimonas chondri TaxID=2681879 RepID=A0ABX1VF29_9PLAN|nr:glycerol-3-phosphate acyltransferase [Alienimonas chondri]NNJ26713.1 Glycerol-3-phosphate acyltransferase [Alienimonas chondri]
MEYALAAGLSYLSGSVPWALLIVRWVAGVDLRSVGSGNPGATNASRVLGKRWGAAILLLDALKGAVPVLVLPRLLEVDGPGDESDAWRHLAVVCGAAAVLGHVFPVWLKFRGGKGVATGLGVTAVLHWPGLLIGAAAFALVAKTTRLVALASTVAAWAFALTCAIDCLLVRPGLFGSAGWSLAGFALLTALLITARHASNFARMRRGEENRWGGQDLKPTEAAGSGPPHRDGEPGAAPAESLETAPRPPG